MLSLNTYIFLSFNFFSTWSILHFPLMLSRQVLRRGGLQLPASSYQLPTRDPTRFYGSLFSRQMLWKRFCSVLFRSARCQIENHHNFPLLPEFLPICHSCFHGFYGQTLDRFQFCCRCCFNCHCHGWDGLAHCRCHCLSQKVPLSRPHQIKRKKKNNFVGNSFDLFSAQQYKSFVWAIPKKRSYLHLYSRGNKKENSFLVCAAGANFWRQNIFELLMKSCCLLRWTCSAVAG